MEYNFPGDEFMDVLYQEWFTAYSWGDILCLNVFQRIFKHKSLEECMEWNGML